MTTGPWVREVNPAPLTTVDIVVMDIFAATKQACRDLARRPDRGVPRTLPVPMTRTEE